MIQSIFRAITVRIGGLQQAAFWLALFSGLSLLLGFVRDRILAHYFGAGLELDMYYAAFEIPDILFVTAASVVSASILVPMFALRAREPKELASFINTIFSYFSVFIVIACVLAFVFMPELVQIFFGGFEAEASKQVIYFSRILLLSPLFLGFSNFFGSIIQYEKRFLLYSLSPLLYNTGIIGGLAFGAVKFGIVSAVFGVVIGAFLHMAIQAIFVFSSSERPRFEKQILSHASWLEIKKVFTLSIPRAISLSAGSLVGLFFVAMASRLSVGSIAVFTLAFNLQAALLSLVGGSFSMAAFPTLSEHYVKKEIQLLIDCLSRGLRHIIFWALPASALFIILRAHIVRVVLGSGAFDWSDTRMTAAVLALFVVSVVFQCLQLFLTRAHYAFGKTRGPLFNNMAGAVFTVFLAFVILNFSSVFSPFFSFVGEMLKVEDLSRVNVLVLPFSFSLGAFISAALLWFSIEKNIRIEIEQSIIKTVRDGVLSSLALSLGIIFALRALNDYFVLDTLLNVFLHGLFSGLFGIACAVLVLFLLKNREMGEIAKSSK